MTVKQVAIQQMKDDTMRRAWWTRHRYFL